MTCAWRLRGLEVIRSPHKLFSGESHGGAALQLQESQGHPDQSYVQPDVLDVRPGILFGHAQLCSSGWPRDEAGGAPA